MTALQAEHLPPRENGVTRNPYIRMYLLPGKYFYVPVDFVVRNELVGYEIYEFQRIIILDSFLGTVRLSLKCPRFRLGVTDWQDLYVQRVIEYLGS